MEQYLALKEKHQSDFDKLNNRYWLVSWLRLIVAFIFLFFFYQYFFNGLGFCLYLGIDFLVLFFVLLKFHQVLLKKKDLEKTLVDINQQEITYLKGEEIPFNNGVQYLNQQHLFSYDLDFFGEHSLFHNINRTATYMGSSQLHDRLLDKLDLNEIRENQSAIAELSNKLEWRQKIRALGILAKDNQKEYDALLKWSQKKQIDIKQIWVILSYVLPLVFLASTIGYFITYNSLLYNILRFSFFLNLGFLLIHLNTIRNELTGATGIVGALRQYGLIIKHIEEASFNSPKLHAMQSQLSKNNGFVSQHILELSKRMKDLESIENGFAAIVFNGSILYHFHSLLKMKKWKEKHVGKIEQWLGIIGEIEMLSSLANLKYNNPEFIFPDLNEDFQISMHDLGHPLISEQSRICNSVDFNSQAFIILTGSNMSGKSTFLRTLGINMVLAGIGSPICAKRANIHPLPVIVSMRQTDSLVDGESYFFAEVKRLKRIVNELQSKTCFVLLDEILRGTNSDDKRSGTIEVIKKIISHQTIGAIATHDLEVCQITSEFPEVLSNKCFEGEIKENELYFDYKLREGICKSKTASFLMKKQGII